MTWLISLQSVTALVCKVLSTKCHFQDCVFRLNLCIIHLLVAACISLVGVGVGVGVGDHEAAELPPVLTS